MAYNPSGSAALRPLARSPVGPSPVESLNPLPAAHWRRDRENIRPPPAPRNRREPAAAPAAPTSPPLPLTAYGLPAPVPAPETREPPDCARRSARLPTRPPNCAV